MKARELKFYERSELAAHAAEQGYNLDSLLQDHMDRERNGMLPLSLSAKTSYPALRQWLTSEYGPIFWVHLD